MMEEQELSPEIYQLIAAGRKIAAIKLIREETGLGLAEAKDLAEAIAGHGVTDVAPPPEMKEEGGVGGILAIVIAVLIAYLVYVFFLGD
jgi:hypothetical protein